jgi:hypothetical protein
VFPDDVLPFISIKAVLTAHVLGVRNYQNLFIEHRDKRPNLAFDGPRVQSILRAVKRIHVGTWNEKNVIREKLAHTCSSKWAPLRLGLSQC